MERTLENFINSCSGFASFTFHGYFDMPREDFFNMWEIYEAFGENRLDGYVAIMDLDMDCFRYGPNSSFHPIYTEEKFSYLFQILDDLDYTQYFEDKKIKRCLNYLNFLFKEHQHRQSVKFKRHKANLFTNNQTIRKKIFEKHGKQCLNCGSNKSLQLDHIIPIRKGGKNSLDNLQPLCKTCNAKKGTKTIDYRK
jgi:hypothetical protein